MAKKARKSSAPENETKADKFKRLASARVSKALKAIGLISNLSSRSGYDYTPAQIEKMSTALREKVETVVSQFNPSAKADTAGEFEL